MGMRPLFFLVLFLAVGFSCYWNAIYIPFMGDDISRIVSAAPTFQNGLLESLANILPDRPFLTFTNWITFIFFGMNAAAFKIINIALHCLTGFMLYRLSNVLIKNHSVALGIGILFVAHPAANQSINIIIQRGVLLASFFALTSTLLFFKFLNSRRKADYCLSLLVFTLGILSKPFIAVLPLIFIIYIFLLRQKEFTNKTLFTWLGPYFLSIAIPVIFYKIMGDSKQTVALPWSDYFFTQLRVIFIYWGVLFYPFKLRYLYDISSADPHALLYTILAALGHLAILGTAFALRLKKPFFSFGIFAAYIAFLPESSFFAIMHTAFEHRTYFPFIFIFIAIGSLVEPLAKQYKKVSFTLFISTLSLLILGCIKRNSEIDTPVKWVKNTIKYQKNDHSFNQHILKDLFALKEYKVGQEITTLLKNAHPNDRFYALFEEIYSYENESPQNQKMILEKIASILIKSTVILDSHTRNFLNFFIIENLSKHQNELNVNILIEQLITPQMSKLSLHPDQYFTLLRKYSSVLNYLRFYYESRSKLSLTEKTQYKRVQDSLKNYFEQK